MAAPVSQAAAGLARTRHQRKALDERRGERPVGQTAGVVGGGGDALGPPDHPVHPVQFGVGLVHGGVEVIDHGQRRFPQVVHHIAQLPHGPHQRDHCHREDSHGRQANDRHDHGGQIHSGHPVKIPGTYGCSGPGLRSDRAASAP